MRMTSRLGVLAVAVLGMALAQQHPGKPNFGAAIYADGEVWGTKGLGELPPPNDKNTQSFDKLFMFINEVAPGQLPVAEASPGNKNYNGGRWSAYTAMWTEAGLAALDPLPLIKSYDEIMLYRDMGYLATAPGAPMGPSYFECPLLPVK